jgi:Helicase conserved C-terminal domain/SNF2-related domain
MSFSVGSLVHARGREWVVIPETTEDLAMLRPLGGGDLEVTGILRALEEIRPARFEYPRPEQAGDYRSSRLLRDALRLGFRASAGPFRSFGHLNFEPRPYQLVPLLMALKQDPVRLLIADDVGIGKTLEAALIAKELLDRGEISQIAVICPPHLAGQWQKELREKLQIEAETVLAGTARRLESECRGGESLFEHFPFTIVSMDYIKSDQRRDDFLRTCPDLVIVDEAHTCAFGGRVSSSQHQRHLLLRKLAEKEDRHVILVTATPHSGNEEAFRSLLAVLNPVFAHLPTEMGGEANRSHRERLALHLVQRKRGDIEHYMNTDTPFPKRQDAELSYALTPGYRAFFDKVLDFVRETVQDETGSPVRKRVRWWSALALLRSMASSPASAASTLRTRAHNLDAETQEETDELGRRSVMDLGEDHDALDASDLPPGCDIGTEDDEGQKTRRRLLDMARQADALFGEPDAKLDLVAHQVRNLLEEGFSPIVFCRFIPTAEYVMEHLRKTLKRQFPELEVAAVTGLLAHADREQRIKELGEANPRVLVATDCLSEGINLQDHFNAVVHYDLSWNPTRHEQRDGRVDRFGQLSKLVKVLTLFGVDNQIDGIVLDVLLRKHKKIRSSLGISVPVPATSDDVLEAVFEGLILRGRDRQNQEQLLPGLEEYLRPKTETLFAQWEADAEREKKSQAIYAQHAMKTEEVHLELEAARQAIGMGVELESFVRDALKGMGAGFTPDKRAIQVDLSECDRSLKDALPTDEPKFPVRFTAPVPHKGMLLTRIHPFVESLASYVLDTALDPLSRSVASRCGVIRTDAVTARTTLLLLRHRMHLITKRDGRDYPMLAEDSDLLAFQGAPEQAQWLDREAAEGLLMALPSGNVAPEQIRDFLQMVLEGIHHLTPRLEQACDERSQALLEAHRRVRQATKMKGTLRVEAQRPPDVLGIYVLLPMPVRGV